jgi:hypothetical protein
VSSLRFRAKSGYLEECPTDPPSRLPSSRCCAANEPETARNQPVNKGKQVAENLTKLEESRSHRFSVAPMMDGDGYLENSFYYKALEDITTSTVVLLVVPALAQ